MIIFETSPIFLALLPSSFDPAEVSSYILLQGRKLAHLDPKEKRSSIEFPLLVVHLGIWGKAQTAKALGLPDCKGKLGQIIPAYTKSSLEKDAMLIEPRFNKTTLEIMNNADFVALCHAVDSWIDLVAPMYVLTFHFEALNGLLDRQGVKGRYLVKKVTENFGLEPLLPSQMFTTVAINCSPISVMQAHLDFSDEFSMLAVVVCLADCPFTGGDLVFWQLSHRAQFGAFDVCALRSRIFVHGNTEVTLKGQDSEKWRKAGEKELKGEAVAGRGSLVFFNGAGIRGAIMKVSTEEENRFIRRLFSDDVHNFCREG
ncbi:hypothetical protein BC830DRAFT_786075 [Chytriomyces sp. MP71]|nr:hypothetical protein BC830DRAFT_786075 [Chytriomyces sp. MP71]